jgi:ABC-2 type transport system permease protein
MRFLSLASRNIKEVYRDPLTVSLGIALPVGLLVLFVSIGKKAPLEIFTVKMIIPGAIVFSFAFLMMFSAMLLAKDRQSAFLTRLLTTPLKSTDFILAYILPFLPIALLQIAVCFLVGSLLGFIFNLSIILSLTVLFPMVIVCVALGMILGSLFTENQIAGIGSILINVIAIFSGGWMDLKMVGGVFEAIGYALPFSHAIDATRAILKGSGFGDIILDFYWVLGYAVVFFILGILCFRWRTKR